MELKFSQDEKLVLEDALRQAAKDYRGISINSPEVKEQFERQEKLARGLLARVEELS